MINLICACLSFIYTLYVNYLSASYYDVSVYIYFSIPGLLLSIWSFYVSKKAYELLADNTRSEEELRDAYYTTPCLCV